MTEASSPSPIRIGSEVAAARANGKPLVALESTIVTHGMPFPDSLSMAREVEAVIRAEGAVPATICVLDGMLQIGLDDSELDALARAPDPMKLSRADLPYALATGRSGGTTVAATMIGAALAGIEVFATGGIGGVHKGAEKSFDISSDLDELARTPVIVVSAGAKAILDIPKTLEVLETRGVPVVGYATDSMPAFWSAGSAHRAPMRLDSAAAVAALWKTRKVLGLGGGMLVANPVQAEAEIPEAEMSVFIDAAQELAEREGVTGKAVTPFLLQTILELTEGRSLVTNIALVKNNARLAAEIAVALAGQTIRT